MYELLNNLLCKLIDWLDWFIYDRSLCHERFKWFKHNLWASLHLHFDRSQDQSKTELRGGESNALIFNKGEAKLQKKLFWCNFTYFFRKLEDGKGEKGSYDTALETTTLQQLKSTGIWKIWFIRLIEMNGYFFQHLNKFYAKFNPHMH